MALKRQPTQATGESFQPDDFCEDAVDHKHILHCQEDNYKLKLQDDGAAISLGKGMKIFSLKDARKDNL